MKKIVKGNDFIMRIPVMKVVDGERQAFPLPGCTDIMVRLCSQFRRYELTYTIDAKDDNVLLARVEGDKMPCGSYALEVRGKIFGNDWRSNEYEQVVIVDRNADADTELGSTDEGENSVEMDTAVVYLPPSAELSGLISEAQETNANFKVFDETVRASEAARMESEERRVKSEESRGQAELARMSAETARQTAEDARMTAESTRAQAEASRQQAESARTKTEIEREANELTRKNNEKTRLDNEAARQTAENERESNATSAINTMQAKADDAVKTMQAKTDAAIASMDEHRTTSDNAETTRVGNEEARVAAETARAEAESERITQEQTRQAAEEKREENMTKFMADCEATMSTAKEYLSEAECVSVQAEDIELEANKYYDITLASTNTLTLTLQATDDTTHAHDYEGGFDTDDTAVPTVAWPEGVQWADMPTLKYGRHYEFNIRVVAGKKYGVVYVWDKE